MRNLNWKLTLLIVELQQPIRYFLFSSANIFTDFSFGILPVVQLLVWIVKIWNSALNEYWRNFLIYMRIQWLWNIISDWENRDLAEKWMRNSYFLWNCFDPLNFDASNFDFSVISYCLNSLMKNRMRNLCERIPVEE